MRKWIALIFCAAGISAKGQELFVFTDPASNIPAHSLSLKLTDHFVTHDRIYSGLRQRLMPQVMFGFSKKFMVSLGATGSNMHTSGFFYESVNLYAKYRFLSHDEIHQHFRMALFTEASLTEAPFHYDEISLMGDKSGVALGVIATALKNRTAFSATVSHTQVLDKSRTDKVIYVPERLYQSVNYSLSAGYLLLPREYNSYKQTNVNLYLEVLGEQSLDAPKHCLDLAPAVQLILNSNAKLNIGYRFQLSGDMSRMSKQNWQLSFERTLLNALKKN